MTAREGTHPALRMLEAIGAGMPGVWKRHEQLRAAYRAEVDWPEWCYAPLAVSLPITGERPVLATKLTALAAWRMTQGIYRVDPTLLEALMATPLDAAVPVDALLRLPEWCVYIELPGIPTFKGAARGVWVSMELASRSEAGPVFVSMLFDTERDMATSLDDKAMLPLSVRLDGESLLAAFENTYKSAPSLVGHFEQVARPVLSILLYLCARNVDLTRDGAPATPSRPQAVRTRRDGARLYPARGPAEWTLGVRMGAALKAAYAQAEAVRASGTGRTVTPHVRSFHWHTFLSGPRKDVPAGKRQRDIRWLAPIAVGFKDVDQLAPVVRPIQWTGKV